MTFPNHNYVRLYAGKAPVDLDEKEWLHILSLAHPLLDAHSEHLYALDCFGNKNAQYFSL